MLLLTVDVLLLCFITIHLGLLAQAGLSRLFRTSLSTDPLGLFLVGLILSTVYFNLLSFWLPVNYWTLVPLFAVACWMAFRHGHSCRRLASSFRELLNLIRTHPILTTLFFILLSLFWLNPSTQPDSRAYHIMTVRWYERFPVVPGLGNLHGRMAFNCSSFILHAAYSFTDLTGQSLYPLNGVLAALFLGWIMVRSLRNAQTPAGWAYLFLLILFYRPLLSYMSSPNSDVLAIVCTAYPLLVFFQSLVAKEKTSLASLLVPLIICLYAPTAKFPAFLVAIPCMTIFSLLPRNEKGFSTLLPLAALAALIYLPWLGRNYILSGYLVYPLRSTGFFHPDWQIPPDMLQLDYLGGKYGSRTITNTYDDFLWLEKASFFTWFPRAVLFRLRVGLYYEMAMLFVGICSPLLWLIRGRQRPPRGPFLFWLAVYIAFWLWVIFSMEFRFGATFLLLSIGLPPLFITSPGCLRSTRWPSGRTAFMGLSLAFGLATIYYIRDDLQVRRAYYQLRQQPFSWREGWLYPLKDAAYFLSPGNYSYYVDRLGHKIYYVDASRPHLDAAEPLQLINYSWYNNKVEIRGERLSSGFRVTAVYPATR